MRYENVHGDQLDLFWNIMTTVGHYSTRYLDCLQPQMQGKSYWERRLHDWNCNSRFVPSLSCFHSGSFHDKHWRIFWSISMVVSVNDSKSLMESSHLIVVLYQVQRTEWTALFGGWKGAQGYPKLSELTISNFKLNFLLIFWLSKYRFLKNF